MSADALALVCSDFALLSVTVTVGVVFAGRRPFLRRTHLLPSVTHPLPAVVVDPVRAGASRQQGRAGSTDRRAGQRSPLPQAFASTTHLPMLPSDLGGSARRMRSRPRHEGARRLPSAGGAPPVCGGCTTRETDAGSSISSERRLFDRRFSWRTRHPPSPIPPTRQKSPERRTALGFRAKGFLIIILIIRAWSGKVVGGLSGGGSAPPRAA